MSKIAILFMCVLIAFGCKQALSEYDLSIQKWHQLRIDSLKGKTGFINLAGLYWLEEGINTFGSDSSNNLNFTGKSSPKMGSFLLKDSLVYLISESDIFIEENLVADTTLVFEEGKAKNMTYKNLFWFVVKRGTKIGVRLRDFENPLLLNFDSIDYFETDPKWKIDAIWKPYDQPIDVSFSNVVGMEIPYSVKGAFYFKVDGNEYKLEPLGTPDPLGYFVMFYDKTSGIATYGSGRYIYIKPPDSLGYTFIDFNKAFNPPCAFTEFATCLFPHKENRLPIFINAGEKFSGH